MKIHPSARRRQSWKSPQYRLIFTFIVIDHFDCAARCMRDEDPPGLRIECGWSKALSGAPVF
ncbi:hypothetical protein [Bradyrhizobium sp. Leo121]|uniref:hypothetical protein n=1 Tax=Bradyrhizobium sp. Leo121 TaxID=1571195 RepID=UPI001028B9FA|nr:hypothetical protein [Bradyrhizobium sp. Leo121]